MLDRLPIDRPNWLDGTSCENPEEVQARVSEHFSSVLNVRREHARQVWDDLPVVEPVEFYDHDPTVDEVVTAIRGLKNGTAAGADGITSELLKVLCDESLMLLVMTFQQVWRDGKVPKEWVDAILVPLPKKGDLSDLNNWRGIALLSVLGKLFAKVLTQRLNALAERVLPESQCGFRAGRGSTDMVHALRMVMERYKEYNLPLYIIFIDLTKAYDSVPRAAMWKVLERYGVPPRLRELVMSFHVDTCVQARVDGELADGFPVLNGLKQGCVMAPVLFSLYAAAAVDHWRRTLPEDLKMVGLLSARDGPIPFGTQKGHRVLEAVQFDMPEGQYADDIGALAPSLVVAQRMIEDFCDAVEAWGMKVSFKKTKIMAVCPETPLEDLTLNDGSVVEAVHSFVYLGSLMHDSCRARPTIEQRITKARKSFFSLWDSVFGRSDMRRDIKRAVYLAAVWGTLLYACETWNVTASDKRILEVFHRDCVRRMCHVKRHSQWRYHISHNSLCRGMRMPTNVCTELRKRRLLWLGKVARMPRHRLPRLATYGFFKERRGRRGRPQKRWVGQVRDDLQAYGFNADAWNWYNLAIPVAQWEAIVEGGEQTAPQEAAREVFTSHTPPANFVDFFEKNDRCSVSRWHSGWVQYKWCSTVPFHNTGDDVYTHVLFDDGEVQDYCEEDLGHRSTARRVHAEVAFTVSMLHTATVAQLRSLATQWGIPLLTKRVQKGILIEQIGKSICSGYRYCGTPGEFRTRYTIPLLTATR